MIDRTFDGLKFKRTYVGGSKKREKEIFIEVQGDESKEYENCDWVGYRNVMIKKYDDYLNVIFSWRYLFKNLSLGFAILTLALLFSYYYKSLNINFLWVIASSLSVSITCLGAYLYFLHKQKLEIRNYDFALSIMNGEIENSTGLKLKKNP